MDQHGVSIRYSVTLKTLCDNAVDSFASYVGIQLRECVKECGIRPHCQGLRYHRRSHLCELLTDTGIGKVTKGACVFIRASDIVVDKVPCTNCADGKTCDTASKVCKFKECFGTDLNNALIWGNMDHVGGKLQYQCNEGYKDRTGNRYAVCLANGSWNTTDVCEKIENVALGKQTSMSSHHPAAVTNGEPGVDGNTQSIFHTNIESNPWWRVDLGSMYEVYNITLYNRIDCCQFRASNLVLKLGQTLTAMIEYGSIPLLDQTKTFTLPENTFTRYVEVALQSTNYLHLGEVEVMGLPA